MTRTIFTDRSRIETYQRCARLRWLEYHEGGIGIAPAKKPLPLAVGGSTHVGLQHLLLGEPEDQAVAAALADFSLHKSALALDTTESAAMTPAEGFDAQVAAQARELGMSQDDPAIAELFQRQRNAAAEFDGWLYAEQAALVEGMVRAYARRRLRPLLEEFEVLEVEREGQWLLSTLDQLDYAPLMLMSRPDALLRSRSDNSLYILSYKTAATWDIRKARDAEHDMQGLSEGVEVERRLGEWWAKINGIGMYGAYANTLPDKSCSPATYEFLYGLPAPPRIMGIRYEYLLKGYRSEDKDLSARFGLKVWAQRSHLIRAYEGPQGWCWSYDFLTDEGKSSKLYYKNWRPKPVWESMPVRQWIDMLDSAEETMSGYDSTTGAEPRALGWHSEAQAQGYTATHPLDEVFSAPMTIYRSDDQLRDWVEQVEAQEVRVAEAVAQIEAAQDEGEKRHLLNVLMPMSRRACSYPTECAFAKSICYGGEDARRDPLATGLFKVRQPHHVPEVEATTK